MSECISLDASPPSVSSLSISPQSSLLTTSDYVERLEGDADILRRILCSRKYLYLWVDRWYQSTRNRQIRNAQRQIMKFQLTNALYRWRLALFRRKQQEEYAKKLYEKNLVSKSRIRWWLRACEALAPGMHNSFLIREAFSTWRQQTAAITHNKGVANRRFNTNLAHRVYQHWLERVDDIMDMGDDAAAHCEWSAADKHLKAWHRHTSKVPTISLVSQRVDRRLVSTSFNTWRLRCRRSLAARALLNAHTLRRGFATWNRNLRHCIIVNHIQERIMLNTLYNWVLQTRYSIFTNDVKRWLLARNTIRHWRRQTRTVVEQRHSQNLHAVHTLKKHLTTKYFRLWCDQLIGQAARKARAVEFFNYVQATATWKPWVVRMKRVLTLQSWVAPTRNYLLLRNHLRQWRIALEHAKRQKLRHAYKHCVLARRQELATRVINHWHSRTQVIYAMRFSAECFNASHIALTAEAALSTWRGHFANIMQLNQIHKSWSNRPLKRASLGVWMSHLKHLRNQEDIAHNFSDIRVTGIAFKLLTKWQIKLFLFRSRETVANMMGERTQKRRVVGLLRFWQDEAGKQKDLRKFAESLDERDDTGSKEDQHSEDWERLVHGGPQEELEEEDGGSVLSRYQTPHRTHRGLIDLETPCQSIPQSFSISSVRRTLFFPHSLSNVGSLRHLQPKISSSTHNSPLLQNLLRTPKDRAARAREFFNSSTSTRALPTP